MPTGFILGWLAIGIFVIAASLPIRNGVLKSSLDANTNSINNASNIVSSVGAFYGRVGVLTNADGSTLYPSNNPAGYVTASVTNPLQSAAYRPATNFLIVTATNTVPADTNSIKFWLAVTNSDGTVGRIPVYQ